MGEESNQLRREIEQTRRELGTDVDALGEKVSPRRVMERRVDRTRSAVGGLKERIMGTTSDVSSSAGGAMSSAASTVQDKVSGAASGVQHAASSVGETATDTAYRTRRQAQGNPLAAGLIVFGLGWLVSSLLPPSEKERQLAHQVKDQAQPVVQAAGEQAGQALSELKDDLRQPAQEAVESVKQTATDAAGTVKDEARSAAADVKDQAQDSTRQVRNQAPSSP